MPLVVITDCDHGTIAPEEAVLRAAGVEYRLHQAKTEDDVVAVARDADAIILQYAPITGRVLDGLPRCRVAVRYGVGVDTVDLQAATERGVVVANVPDYCMEEVSDHALAMGLALWRGVVLYDRAIRGGTWNATMKTPMYRLHKKVVGVIGLGRIGACFARKAMGVGMTAIGYDPYLTTLPEGVRSVSFETLLREADLISLHLPLSAATKHLINEAALRLMKPTALLVNTARGGLVDTKALCGALQDGQLGGAALDTLEQEPIPADSPLLSFPNVILGPHAGWYSDQSVTDLKRKTAEAAIAVLRGQRPYSPVNPDVYTGLEASWKRAAAQRPRQGLGARDWGSGGKSTELNREPSRMFRGSGPSDSWEAHNGRWQSAASIGFHRLRTHRAGAPEGRGEPVGSGSRRGDCRSSA